MTDDNTLTKHLMNFRDQVLRFASEKDHQHQIGNKTDTNKSIPDAYTKLAQHNHATTSNEFGVGDENNYGHVKLQNSVTSNSSNGVKSSGISTAITTAISNLKTELEGKLQTKLSIVKEVKSTSTDDTIPTSKAVWDALTSYEDILSGVSLAKPKLTTANIENITEPGYYRQNSKTAKYFNYAGKMINYNQGLIKVEVADNRVIQHVYATEKVQSGNSTYYKLNGCEYRRYGVGEVATNAEGNTMNINWNVSPWHAVHIPYRSISPIKHSGPGIDNDSIVVFENTAGFIFHWDQNATDDDRYNVHAPLYEYAEICTFGEELPIRGPYVFSNLIGRMDIKITSTGMYIRSNVQPGGHIIEVHETFFVPRNH